MQTNGMTNGFQRPFPALTPAQRYHLDVYGYVVVEKTLTENEVGTLREALQQLGSGETERELPIKYDLMVSLMEFARAERNGTHAREAGEICSVILRRDISYRDIRAKRKEIDALMKEFPA